jgi:uncharacterized protein with PIN domain
MARVYVDEDVPEEVAVLLRSWGHDVVTTDEVGRKSADDASQLAYATATGRIIITHNRQDYRRLHRRYPGHSGIVNSTRDDADKPGLAARIHHLLSTAGDMAGRLKNVYKPAKP